MPDFKRIENKWQKLWEEAKIFEPEISEKPKFFLTFPYPYMNSLSHVGHFYTLLRVDVFARYKRMRGFNVLFPQAWHCTGSPIINAAQRIKDREPKQVQIMNDMGFSDKEIKKFSDPEYWVKYFPKEYRKDYKEAGISIDFRREFITTELNPYYDKFIRWQFNKLKQRKYIVKGKHPVVWCPKENTPVGDHARVEGEGETPQEFTLVKFKINREYLVAATLRPETVFGQTNLWVDPDLDYCKVKVNNETWIVSKECFEKLKEQYDVVEVVGKVKGKELLGKKVLAPGVERKIMILPSGFCDPSKGTGIVTSVPSDAPDDWMGLYDLQKDDKLCKKYGLNYEDVKKIKPIAIIDSEDLGDMPAVKVCEEMGIKSQNERGKLEKAKKVVYKKGFYAGVMKKNCGKYSGKTVEKAKDLVKENLIKEGKADKFYELTGKVICRCLTPSIVKIVSDQWFLDYSDPKWKKQVHKALKNIKLYPEKVRQQFEYVIDWLDLWACTREFGLGTRLPWDEQWLIESLSDSTIYMAYYTISHLIKEVPIDDVDDKLFDYVFLDRGKKPDVKYVDEMKKEFEYWYPLDFRNSGKDLIQNHLAFFIFNHTAIFPTKYWPRGIGVNGWVTVDGEKMSKSKGNFLMLRECIKNGADSARLTIMSGGEGLDDVSWDTELAKSMPHKLEQLYDFYLLHHKEKGVRRKKVIGLRQIDYWMESKLNKTIKKATEFMEETMFRSALKRIYYDLSKDIRWYLRRTDKPNKKLIKNVLEAQLLMLSPFIPHFCEEIWRKFEKEDYISVSSWPSFEEEKIKEDVEAGEELISNTLGDIRSIIKLIDRKPSKIKLFIAESWKYDFVKDFKLEFEKIKDVSKLIKKLIFAGHEKEVARLIFMFVKNPVKVPEVFLDYEQEQHLFKESKEFLEREFNCKVEIVRAEKSKEVKAKQAIPGKLSILIE